ncbi:MAG: hypothetical protein V3R78_10135 [Thermodesulfobacteriota bacterium]
MIIKDSDRADPTLVGTTYEGDHYTHHHAQDTSTIQAGCHELRQDGTNGWTEERTMRKIASIPALDAVRLGNERPGFFSSPEMIGEYLKREGEKYLTVKKNTI